MTSKPHKKKKFSLFEMILTFSYYDEKHTVVVSSEVHQSFISRLKSMTRNKFIRFIETFDILLSGYIVSLNFIHVMSSEENVSE